MQMKFYFKMPIKKSGAIYRCLDTPNNKITCDFTLIANTRASLKSS